MVNSSDKSVTSSELGSEPATSAKLPTSTSELGSRLLKIADRMGSQRAAAAAAGVSEGAFYRYTRGENAPPFDVIARLCAAAGVSLDWLGTGKGTMLVGGSMTTYAYDPKKGHVGESNLAGLNASQDLRQTGDPLDTGLLATAVRMSDEILTTHGIRGRFDSSAFESFVRIVFDDLKRGRSEEQAGDAVKRILAIASRPESTKT